VPSKPISAIAPFNQRYAIRRWHRIGSRTSGETKAEGQLIFLPRCGCSFSAVPPFSLWMGGRLKTSPGYQCWGYFCLPALPEWGSFVAWSASPDLCCDLASCLWQAWQNPHSPRSQAGAFFSCSHAGEEPGCWNGWPIPPSRSPQNNAGSQYTRIA